MSSVVYVHFDKESESEDQIDQVFDPEEKIKKNMFFSIKNNLKQKLCQP